MNERLSRRHFLKALVLSGAGLALSSCAPQAEAVPTLTVNENEAIKQIRMNIIDNIIHQEYNMVREKSHITEQGLKINLFSDDFSKLEVNWSDVEAVMNSVENFVKMMPDNDEYKQQILDAYKAYSSGKFKDREILMVVPSDPQSCLNEGKQAIVKIPANEDYASVCSGGNAFTMAATIKVKGEMKIPTLALMVLSPATIDGSVTLSPDFVPFELNAEQSQASMLFHEFVHLLLRFSGVAQNIEIEEKYVQKVEKIRLEFFQQTRNQEKTPFKYGNNSKSWELRNFFKVLLSEFNTGLKGV